MIKIIGSATVTVNRKGSKNSDCKECGPKSENGESTETYATTFDMSVVPTGAVAATPAPSPAVPSPTAPPVAAPPVAATPSPSDPPPVAAS